MSAHRFRLLTRSLEASIARSLYEGRLDDAQTFLRIYARLWATCGEGQ